MTLRASGEMMMMTTTTATTTTHTVERNPKKRAKKGPQRSSSSSSSSSFAAAATAVPASARPAPARDGPPGGSGGAPNYGLPTPSPKQPKRGGGEQHQHQRQQDATAAGGVAKSLSASSSSSPYPLPGALDLSRAPPQWRRRLEEDGYLVVRGVLTTEECRAYLHGMWSFVGSLNPAIDRRDPNTWYHTQHDQQQSSSRSSSSHNEAATASSASPSSAISFSSTQEKKSARGLYGSSSGEDATIAKLVDSNGKGKSHENGHNGIGGVGNERVVEQEEEDEEEVVEEKEEEGDDDDDDDDDEEEEEEEDSEEDEAEDGGKRRCGGGSSAATAEAHASPETAIPACSRRPRAGAAAAHHQTLNGAQEMQKKMQLQMSRMQGLIDQGGAGDGEAVDDSLATMYRRRMGSRSSRRRPWRTVATPGPRAGGAYSRSTAAAGLPSACTCGSAWPSSSSACTARGGSTAARTASRSCARRGLPTTSRRATGRISTRTADRATCPPSPAAVTEVARQNPTGVAAETAAAKVGKKRAEEEEEEREPPCSLLKCVQGSVALLNQDPEDGCFQCWPGSHKVHPDIMRLNGIGNTGNYYELGPDDKALLERRGCNAYRISVSSP